MGIQEGISLELQRDIDQEVPEDTDRTRHSILDIRLKNSNDLVPELLLSNQRIMLTQATTTDSHITEELVANTQDNESLREVDTHQ